MQLKRCVHVECMKEWFENQLCYVIGHLIFKYAAL